MSASVSLQHVTKQIMKTYNCSIRSPLLLLITCLTLGISGTQAISAGTESHRVTAAGSTSVQSAGDDARLIIRRIPNLGNALIIDMYVDGVAVLPITYGQTYEGSLSPGRHVLSVLATPHPKWPEPTETVLNVRKGQIYSFTAMGDGSGRLILKGS
jgi:hypothetical protein